MLPLLLLLPLAASPTWTWPLAPPAVVRPYAPGPTPYSPGHRGADLAGAPGQPVLAAGAGRVSYAGLLAGRGVVVVVHGELRTTYEPVAAEVAVGQEVAAGELLGALQPGHEGCPAAACLHWGLRRGEAYLDPVGLVDPGPVRLLPLAGGPGGGGRAGAAGPGAAGAGAAGAGAAGAAGAGAAGAAGAGGAGAGAAGAGAGAGAGAAGAGAGAGAVAAGTAGAGAVAVAVPVAAPAPGAEAAPGAALHAVPRPGPSVGRAGQLAAGLLGGAALLVLRRR